MSDSIRLAEYEDKFKESLLAGRDSDDQLSGAVRPAHRHF